MKHRDHQANHQPHEDELASMLSQLSGDEPAFSGLQQRLHAIPEQYPRQTVSSLVSQLLAMLWPPQLSSSLRFGRLAFLALLPMALGVSLGQVVPSDTQAAVMTAETEWYYLAFGDVSSELLAAELEEGETGP